MPMKSSISADRNVSRSRVWVVSAVVAALVAGGLAAWQLWPSEGPPPVAVPRFVCAEKIPGKLVSDLLPRTGKAFHEDVDYRFEPTPSGQGPSCLLSAGGRGITINYFRLLGEEFLTDLPSKYEQRSKQPGFRPLDLGNAHGYSGSHSAGITLDCSTSKLPGIVVVSVDGRGFPEEEQEGVRSGFTDLVADSLRVARATMKCADSEEVHAQG